MFAQVADVSFSLEELAASHVRPADLEPSRRASSLSIAKPHGVGPLRSPAAQKRHAARPHPPLL
jgi:hypothetical protein